MRQPRPFRLGYGALPDSYPSERPFSAGLDFRGPNGEQGLIVFDGTEWPVLIDGVQVGTIPGGGGGGGNDASVWREFDAFPGFLTPTIGRRVVIPFDYEITGWAISSTDTGNATFDVRRATTLSGGLTSIVASAPPAIAASSTAESTTLTGWTTTGNAGDVLVIDLVSVAGFSGIRLDLRVTPT